MAAPQYRRTPASSGASQPSREMPHTFDPRNASTSDGVALANRAVYNRIKDSATITKLAVVVTASSGFLSLAVARGTAGRAHPTSRVATSGAVACPAVGYAEVALGASVAVDGATDWFAISFDNTTAKIRANTRPGLDTSALALGWCGWQDTAHPVPDPPAPNVGFQGSLCIVGVA